MTIVIKYLLKQQLLSFMWNVCIQQKLVAASFPVTFLSSLL